MSENLLDFFSAKPAAEEAPAAAAAATVKQPKHKAAPIAAAVAPAASSKPARANANAAAAAASLDAGATAAMASMSLASSSASAKPASGGGSTATTLSGVAYTVPHSSPSAAFNRRRWSDNQLRLRAGEFTDTKQLRVFVGSWNVNGKKPRDEADLSAWLLHRVKCKGDKKSASAEAAGDDDDSGGEDAASAESKFKAPDVYVVGFQEIVDLNAGNLLVDHQASEPWEDFLAATLERTGKEYAKVTTVHLVGLSLCVFVRAKHVPAVADVQVDEVGVGIMGVGGNKGAVLIKLKLYKTTFCFINSHLAAHQGAVKARNADFWSIIRRASFEGPKKQRIKTASGLWIDPEANRRREAEESGSQNKVLGMNVDNFAASASSFFDSVMTKSKVMIDNASKSAGKKASASASASAQPAMHEEAHEDGVSSMEDLESIRSNPHGIFYGSNHIIWLGDNNYRLNVVELGMAATHRLIEAHDYTRLLSYDQLIAEKKARNAFIGFTEPLITFLPTYKFITGTSEYDQRAEKKVRFPAYTDRIQYMTTRPAHTAGSLTALAAPGGEIVLNSLHCLYYTSAWTLQASDHKPVMQLLEAPVVFEREKAKRRVVEDLEHLADEECTPRLLLNTVHLDFGTVPFAFAVTRSFVIKNVGDTVVAYRVFCRSGGINATSGGEAALNKPWLRILPSSGLLARGQTQSVHVTMYVSSRGGAAQSLNAEAEELMCDLLLRLDGGVIYKLHVDATYEKSVCGSDLAYLNSLPVKNIRKADPQAVVDNDTSYSIPQFLFKLVDFMQEQKQILKLKQGAFVPPQYQSEEDEEDDGGAEDDDEEEASVASHRKSAPASPRDRLPHQVCTAPMRWVLDYLDTGRALDKEPKAGKWNSPAAPAPTSAPSELPASVFLHTLLYWLSSLPSPLLVASTSQRWVTGSDLTAWCLQTLLESDVDRYRTLVYVLTFAREAVHNQRLNGLDVASFSTMLAAALCHKAPAAALSPIMPISPQNIVSHLLTCADFGALPADNTSHLEATSLARERGGSAIQPRARYADIE